MEEQQYKKEYEEILKNLEDAVKTPTTSEFPFDLISKRISFLIQAGDILDNHIEELEESLKKVLKETKIPPSSAILIDYVLLDINLFYELAEEKDIPITLPSTRKDVERFRHNIMAHFQRGNNAEVVAEYRIVGKIGFLKIYHEWIEFRDKVFNLLNSKGKVVL